MTYQFLIVDDEYFVRQRIRLCIPWKEYGFECAGEAANVEQALLRTLSQTLAQKREILFQMQHFISRNIHNWIRHF